MNEESRWTRGLLIILLPGILFIVCLFIYPFLYGLYLSLTDADGAFTLANYIKFFTDQWESRTVGITLSIAVPATAVAVGQVSVTTILGAVLLEQLIAVLALTATPEQKSLPVAAIRVVAAQPSRGIVALAL